MWVILLFNEMRLKSYLVVLHICVRWSYSRLESRSSPASPIISSVPWAGAVLGRLSSVSMNNMNKSDVTTQGTSQTVEDTQSKIMSTVETTANETSDVTAVTSFKTTVNADKTVHEMKDLMARPTLLETGKITSAGSTMVFSYDAATYAGIKTTGIPGILSSFAFPQALVRNNPVVASKIKQFVFMKADIKFELKVNCPPNVSGALLVVYMPVGDEVNLDYTNVTIQGLTSCPCKILDYSADTSLTMTVPYINQYDYYNRQQVIVNGDERQNVPQPFGKIFVFNLQRPLSSSTADFVSYTALASLENVELSLPTADRIPSRNLPDDAPYYAQSGNMVQRIPGRDIMSSAGNSSDIRLSYSTIAPKGDFVTYDKDEMDLSYILKRENIIGEITYAKGRDAENSSYLGKVRCFPKRVRVSGGYNTTTGWKETPKKLACQMGSFDYVSNLFGRYTGTIKIGLRLIKTKFHYGRFAVIFDPYNKLDDAPVNLRAKLSTLLSTNYSIVIDLNGNDGEEGGSNYYSIEVPYINNAGFSLIGDNSLENPLSKNVPLAYQRTTASTTFVSRECYNPHLRFYALTELGYLSSAADEVPILVSISAGDDYKLSVPRVNVRLADPPLEVDPYYAQSALTLVPLTKSSSNSNTTQCNGEIITSLKEVANRFTAPTVPMGSTLSYSHSYTSSTGPKFSSKTTPEGYVLSLHQNTPYGLKLSNYEAVAALYRFAFGGRRYKVMAGGSAWIMARLLHSPVYLGMLKEDSSRLVTPPVVAPSVTSAVALSGEMIVDTDVNNMLEIERPFYSNRKLITNLKSTVPEKGLCSDEVVTQLLAISKERSQMVELRLSGSGAGNITVGPGYIVDSVGSTTGVDSLCKQAIPISTVYNPGAGQAIITTPALAFTERIIENNPSGKIYHRSYVTGPVLEALGSGAGCTFLQAPPCVIFG